VLVFAVIASRALLALCPDKHNSQIADTGNDAIRASDGTRVEQTQSAQISCEWRRTLGVIVTTRTLFAWLAWIGVAGVFGAQCTHTCRE